MRDVNTLDALLARTEPFGAVPEEVRAAAAAVFHPVRFEAGRTLFLHGDTGSHAFIVAEGLVRLGLGSAAGREISVRIAGPGSLLGEIAILDGGPRSADATAISPVAAFALADGDFHRLIEHHPALARATMRYLCARLRATTDRLEGIALHSLEVRLARFLLEALQEHLGPQGRTDPQGRMGHPGEGGRRPALELGYSQSELARLIGGSRPKTNLALGALEEAGAIRRTSDRLFCDPALLAAIAGLDDG